MVVAVVVGTGYFAVASDGPRVAAAAFQVAAAAVAVPVVVVVVVQHPVAAV